MTEAERIEAMLEEARRRVHEDLVRRPPPPKHWQEAAEDDEDGAAQEPASEAIGGAVVSEAGHEGDRPRGAGAGRQAAPPGTPPRILPTPRRATGASPLCALGGSYDFFPTGGPR